jgi:hypothetical protein
MRDREVCTACWGSGDGYRQFGDPVIFQYEFDVCSHCRWTGTEPLRAVETRRSEVLMAIHKAALDAAVKALEGV